MPLPLQVIQENIKEFKDKYESIDLALLSHKAFDGFNRQENAIPEVLSWHKSSLISLIDALIEGEQEKTRLKIFAVGKSSQFNKAKTEGYYQSGKETIGRLQALKEEIKKL